MAAIGGSTLAGPDPLLALLNGVARGETEAFRDLYTRTARRLFGLAMKVVQRPELAEEVVQEVFVQVWSSAGRFDPSRGEPLVWLFTMTHRRAVEVVRREQACLERDSRHHRETTALGQYSVEELILRRVEDEKIRASLSTLSRAQSEAITLAYLDGQTYAEVAGTLNLSLPAVKSRIRDGFRNMRQCLGREGAG
ncbi:sigma-70 family RNA polymerase sigma factor [Pseudarthrobacter sp. NS4]|uniref:sigma-70 family RNA polymerase sigma factor n=1 Tax=Pseudarthrobacter sp. NS4 TaxID=2973976 RepID=UPI002163113F|nr:sigma-70 family RNA polymerase sigma factor [Pseudarthrobacter sp. NS4]